MNMPISYIKACAKNNKINFSAHAIQRMGERKIRKNKVLHTIIYGEVIEQQDYTNLKNSDIKVVFQEECEDVPEMYVVVAACAIPEVITVCKTNEEVWDYVKGRLKRRKKYD